MDAAVPALCRPVGAAFSGCNGREIATFSEKSTLQWIVAPRFTFIYTCMQPQSRFLDFFGWLFYHRGSVAVILHAMFRCLAGPTIIRVCFSEKKLCFSTLGTLTLHWSRPVPWINSKKGSRVSGSGTLTLQKRAPPGAPWSVRAAQAIPPHLQKRVPPGVSQQNAGLLF